MNKTVMDIVTTPGPTIYQEEIRLAALDCLAAFPSARPDVLRAMWILAVRSCRAGNNAVVNMEISYHAFSRHAHIVRDVWDYIKGEKQ